MKKLFILTLATVSLNTHAIVGAPIKSSLTDQVCHLSLKGTRGDTCTGVRISEDYVLTAEHCARLDGVKNTISLECGGKDLKVEEVYESKQYANNWNQKLSQVDFALIKIKKEKPGRFSKPVVAFVPKFRLLKNMAEYKTVFLNSTEGKSTTFNENTYCELHGFGAAGNGQAGMYHNGAVHSTNVYKDETYLMTANFADEDNGWLNSPVLPEANKKLNWNYTTARYGDSGGPLLCKSRSGEWVLAGITSTLTVTQATKEELEAGEVQGKCTGSMQEGTKRSPMLCFGNNWGIPTIDYLEKLLGVRITQ